MIDPVQALADVATPVVDGILPTYTHHPGTFPTAFPGYSRQEAGDTGKRTLWVVFVIMLLSTFAFIGLGWRVPVAKRLYHTITTLIVLIATLSYFAMATGDGIGTHRGHESTKKPHIPEHGVVVVRQVYWARYVDWLLTTPLLLLDLSLLAGLNGAQILTAISADVVMILTGLFAAFGHEGTPQKWGWYTIGCLAYLVIVWQLVVHGRSSAMARGGKVGGFFASIAGFTLILWTAYPVVWGVADGARKASVDNEIIAYAVLDVLAKPVFGLWLLLTHINLPETHVDLHGFWAHGFSGEGSIRVGDDDDGA